MLNASSTVRWILVGRGGETGLHTPYFENAILLAQGIKVISLPQHRLETCFVESGGNLSLTSNSLVLIFFII